MHPPIHFIVEYNPSPNIDPEAPNTIRNHENVISERASVLWPKMSKTGRLSLSIEGAQKANENIRRQQELEEGENHFYMYSPKYPGFERRLHVGRLIGIHREGEFDLEDPRIPSMYDKWKKEMRIPFVFELTAIREAPESEIDAVLTNLLTYPDATFLDLVSLISPQAVLEAEPISSFSLQNGSAFRSLPVGSHA